VFISLFGIDGNPNGSIQATIVDGLLTGSKKQVGWNEWNFSMTSDSVPNLQQLRHEALKLRSEKSYDRSIELLAKAIRLFPRNADLRSDRGITYALMDDKPKAVRDLDEAIRMNSQSIIAFFNRGLVYARMGDTEQAINDFTQVKKIDPLSHGAYYNRGVVYKTKGELNNAISDFSSALKYDPNSKRALKLRAEVYRMVGKIELAVADEKKHSELP
jgi:tetratricopeptide (TPR) repeat protein